MRTETGSNRLGFASEVVKEAQIVDPDIGRKVYEAFSTVPREIFIPREYQKYANKNVSISFDDQYLIKPSILARMLSLILPGSKNILEIGCSTGYTAALLKTMKVSVFSIEDNPRVAQKKRKALDELKMHSVIVGYSKFNYGMEENSPYEGIMFMKPIEKISNAVFGQLTEDGKLLAPIGNNEKQRLYLWKKKG